MTKLRINQRDGYVFEAYAEASAKVENMKRIASDTHIDPLKGPRLTELHRKAKNHREQARARLDPFDEADTELTHAGALSPEEIKHWVAERERLVGEIFIRLYRIDLVDKAVKKVLGA